MALLHPSPPETDASEPEGPVVEVAGMDEIIDLTDRRRVLLHAVFGVTVPAPTADEVFTAADAVGVSAPR